MVKVLIKKLDPTVKLPEYKTCGASGVDLTAFIKETIDLKPKKSVLVPTGLSVAFSEDFEIQIRPRSGLAFRHGLTVTNAPGTIDSDYRGELKVLLVNLGKEPVTIERGMRIGQLVIAPVVQASVSEVATLDETERGAGGFGSTGV